MENFKIWKTITIDKPVTKNQLKKANINLNLHVPELLKQVDFIKETVDLVFLQVKDLDIPSKYPTTDQIYVKAQELGLELCPASVGPVLRLEYKNQPLNEWVFIGMKQINDSGGYPYVFRLARLDDGLWLDRDWAYPDDPWNPGLKFVFRLRKSLDTKSLKSYNPLTLIFEIRERLDKLEKII